MNTVDCSHDDARKESAWTNIYITAQFWENRERDEPDGEQTNARRLVENVRLRERVRGAKGDRVRSFRVEVE